MRIDSSQRVLIGLTTSEAVASTTAADLQVVTGGIGVSIVSTAGASGPAGILALGHKRGAGGVVLDDDGLGDIRFAGHDGTDLESQAAIIRASVDGTPGSNDMPGRLEFYTTADGAAASTERMRIKYVSLAVSRHSNDIESGQLGFAKSRGSTANSKTTVGNGDTLGIITFQGADGSNLVEAARILVATDNPASGDDMPGRLQFYTTADGASSPTERMRINSNGAMLFDVESGGIMAMRVGTSAGVATDCFEINLSGATFACYVDVVTNQSAGYAGRTSQFLWYARRAPAGNSRGTVELSTNSLGSVNAGVVAVATITASATNPTGTLERFQITTNLATDSIYCIIRAIGNIPTLKILN
jgi:hypothetical protein